MESIEATKVYHKGSTVKITKRMKIPARTLVVLEGRTNLKKYQQHQFYEMSPDPVIEKEYPHLIMYPILHQANMCHDCGPIIPVSTFVWAGVSDRPVYASGHYGDLVWDGYRILFLLWAGSH